jgi:hypothetical protein
MYVSPCYAKREFVAPEADFGRLVVAPRLELTFPGRTLTVDAGRFRSETAAYAAVSALRATKLRHKFLVALGEEPWVAVRVELPNDLLTAIPEVQRLRSNGVLTDSGWAVTQDAIVRRWWDENLLFEQTYAGLKLPTEDGSTPGSTIVADTVAVASFFDLPLRAFVVHHTSTVPPQLQWQSPPHCSHVVVARSDRKSLAADKASVEWQETEAALMHAHALYLADKREYGALPARCRPPRVFRRELPVSVLLTYAALLLRDLADRSFVPEGNSHAWLTIAPDDPNVRQAIGVRRASLHAKRVLAHAFAVNRHRLLDAIGLRGTW